MVLPVPLMTAANRWVATSGVSMSNVAKKFEIKVCLSSREAVLLVHIKAACVALGSETEGLRQKEKKKKKRKSEG